MRGIGNHTPPELMQPKPADNTSEHVMHQVRKWERSLIHGSQRFIPGGYLIHTESAREIAAWWQSVGPSGINLTEFASTGTISDDLAKSIERITHDLARMVETCTQCEADQELIENVKALRALLAYVRACQVIVYTVGKNTAGYTPEADVHATLDRQSAQGMYNSMLRDEAPEDVARTDECTCDDIDDTRHELCELCTVDAMVSGAITDGDTKIGDKGTGMIIPADSWAGSMSYWVHPEKMTYGKYLDEYADKD